MPLHSQSVQFLAAAAAKNSPGWNELPLDDARSIFDGMTDAFGVGPELDRVEDLVTPDSLPLRLYQKSAEAVCPVVMFFHGGGFVLGSIESHDTLCRRLAFESGLTIVSVDYRLAPEHVFPAAFDDCYRATEFVVGNAVELQVDGSRIVVAGDSAGGGLAAAVSLKASEIGQLSICGQVLIYPVLDHNFKTRSYSEFSTDFGLTRGTMMWFWNCYLHGKQQGQVANVEPYAAVLQSDSFESLPQTYIQLAEYDVLYDEGKEFARRLEDDGVPVTVQQFDGMLHGFVHFSEPFDDSKRAIREAAMACLQFTKT
ncbi:MAG: alpha/beta hydrolase [Fuerstiella sp.]